jgi:hypothetical protein
VLETLVRIADTLQLEPPSLVAEPLALAAVCPDDGLIIQVGAQSTGVILSRYGAPAGCAGICMGGLSLTEGLSWALGVSTARADLILRAYVSGQLAESDQSTVSEALRGPLSTWMAAVTDSLRSWTGIQGEWPPNIHLCGGASVVKDLERLVATTLWPEIAPFPYTPQLRIWDGHNVAQVLDRTDRRWRVNGLTPLALAAWTLRDRGPASNDGILRTSLGI